MTNISPESPEERRKRCPAARVKVGDHWERVKAHSYGYEVVKRVAVGVYSDGFIHAGNLAYLALLTLFPFVIVAAAVARLVGQQQGGMEAVIALLQMMPPSVADVLSKPIADVIEARSGSLLWFGALVGLWTTGSFIETIRDIIRRAYGVTYSRPFWEYRLGSVGMIIASVMGLVLFGSLYLLFYSLTPLRYRKRGCLKWPGALFVTLWWLATTALLPVVLRNLGSYDLTYGSLAGVMIALIFFFIIGLGVVIGAELNAALAETPEEGLKEGEEAFYNRESV